MVGSAYDITLSDGEVRGERALSRLAQFTAAWSGWKRRPELDALRCGCRGRTHWHTCLAIFAKEFGGDWRLGEAEAMGARADPVAGRRNDLIVSFLTAPG